MRNCYSQYLRHPLLVAFALILASFNLSAQLILERELVGAAVAYDTPISTDGTQQLLVDASFGETMIGYEEGDIIITVGFHQPGINAEDGLEGSTPEEALVQAAAQEEEEEEVSVTAYPNPTIEYLAVDLGEFTEKISELRLIDITGRTVATRYVADRQVVIFDRLEDIPNANYFLQGIDRQGKLHNLATVIILKE